MQLWILCNSFVFLLVPSVILCYVKSVLGPSPSAFFSADLTPLKVLTITNIQPLTNRYCSLPLQSLEMDDPKTRDLNHCPYTHPTLKALSAFLQPLVSLTSPDSQPSLFLSRVCLLLLALLEFPFSVKLYSGSKLEKLLDSSHLFPKPQRSQPLLSDAQCIKKWLCHIFYLIYIVVSGVRKSNCFLLHLSQKQESYQNMKIFYPHPRKFHTCFLRAFSQNWAALQLLDADDQY